MHALPRNAAARRRAARGEAARDGHKLPKNLLTGAIFTFHSADSLYNGKRRTRTCLWLPDSSVRGGLRNDVRRPSLVPTEPGGEAQEVGMLVVRAILLRR